MFREGGSLFCEGNGKRHCYDVARSGYVNLLPPGKGGNDHTGDDAEMIASRSRFLSKGYYDSFSDAAAELAARHISSRTGETLNICDAGCGDGYHTLRISDRLSALTGKAVSVIGIDASKRGAAAGARRVKDATEKVRISFAAANIFSMPVADRSLDVLYSIFAPVPVDEARRVVKDNGFLAVVSSAPRHLWELRCLLYDEPRESTPPKPPEGWRLIDCSEVRECAELTSNETVMDLFSMTPFFWRTSRESAARLNSVRSLTVSVEADLFLYVREDRQ